MQKEAQGIPPYGREKKKTQNKRATRNKNTKKEKKKKKGLLPKNKTKLSAAYSSKVVAPMQWSSPRARAGFRILAQSIAPST